MNKKLAALAFAATFSFGANAADVTMTGDYLKVGVNNGGSLIDFGTFTGIQFDRTGSGNFVSAQDILTPGNPFAFYSIGTNGTYQTAGAGSASNPFGATTVSLGGAGAFSYSFSGLTTGGLSFAQTLIFDPNASHFTVQVSLSNVTTSAVSNVIYAVGFDPDQDIGYGGSFNTQNTVLGSGTNAAVSAFGSASMTKVTLSNVTNDNTLGGSVGNVYASVTAAWDQNPYTLIGGPNDGNGDHTISLAYHIGSLAAGQTAAFAYDIAVAAVPEPGEWALMLSGLGLIGVMVRRRTASRAA